jgi:hypothetical protein
MDWIAKARFEISQKIICIKQIICGCLQQKFSYVVKIRNTQIYIYLYNIFERDWTSNNTQIIQEKNRERLKERKKEREKRKR